MPKSEILTETIEIIRNVAADEIGKLAIERAVVGLFFTGVKLSTGHVGACATPVKTIPDAVCCPTSAHAMPFPGKMRGRRAADFLDEVQHQDGIRRAVGIAAMNALAAFCWDRRPHPAVDLETDVDAFDAAAIAPDQMVVVVGAFVPFLRELKRRGNMPSTACAPVIKGVVLLALMAPPAATASAMAVMLSLLGTSAVRTMSYSPKEYQPPTYLPRRPHTPDGRRTSQSAHQGRGAADSR